MQIDMHYYGVYALARVVGIRPEEAKLIACSSQFVDEVMDDDNIHFEKYLTLP